MFCLHKPQLPSVAPLCLLLLLLLWLLLLISDLNTGLVQRWDDDHIQLHRPELPALVHAGSRLLAGHPGRHRSQLDQPAGGHGTLCDTFL